MKQYVHMDEKGLALGMGWMWIEIGYQRWRFRRDGLDEIPHFLFSPLSIFFGAQAWIGICI
jgi:hypothetical protein